MEEIGETPKTYCDMENGCIFCDLLLCDRKKEDTSLNDDLTQ